MSRAIVFTRTKHGADRVVRQLHDYGIRSEAIHGNKSQNARQRALENFRASKTPVLVATDIASRGIDIDDVSHVVNFDLSHEPETYVHRIGRTARAGASGTAVSFCSSDELPNLKGIERLIRRSIPVKADQPTFAARPPSEDVHGGRGHATHAQSGHRSSHTQHSPQGQRSQQAQHPQQGQRPEQARRPQHAQRPGGGVRTSHPLHRQQRARSF
jgi:ATP-dependent RNA helicase RhlE